MAVISCFGTFRNREFLTRANDTRIQILHELSIRYSYHRLFHEVIEPLYRNITRGTSAGKEIAEKLLKITALLLIRMAL